MNEHEELAPLLAAYELNLLAAEDRQKFERHILECDLCFEDGYSFAPVIEHLKPAQRHLAAKTSSRFFRFARMAVAACIVVFAAAGYWIFRETQTGIDMEDRTRGENALQLITPAENQSLRSPVTFQWQSNSSARYYVIHIIREGGAELTFRAETNSFQWPIPPDPYSPGPYNWGVDACLSDGTVIAKSKPRHLVLD